MAIDIKNINEITFTQSFRGYNTEEVDDFLDDLYEEATANNKEIEELKKKIASLENGTVPEGGGMSQEEAYSIIANAQEEADKIIDNARKKSACTDGKRGKGPSRKRTGHACTRRWDKLRLCGQA